MDIDLASQMLCCEYAVKNFKSHHYLSSSVDLSTIEDD